MLGFTPTLGQSGVATVFFPSHETLMKRLLTKARGEEGEFTSKMAMLGEKTIDLEHKVQDLFAQLNDMKSSF